LPRAPNLALKRSVDPHDVGGKVAAGDETIARAAIMSEQARPHAVTGHRHTSLVKLPDPRRRESAGHDNAHVGKPFAVERVAEESHQWRVDTSERSSGL
jgi:hypothetical protein